MTFPSQPLRIDGRAVASEIQHAIHRQRTARERGFAGRSRAIESQTSDVDVSIIFNRL